MELGEIQRDAPFVSGQQLSGGRIRRRGDGRTDDWWVNKINGGTRANGPATFGQGKMSCRGREVGWSGGVGGNLLCVILLPGTAVLQMRNRGGR